MSDRQPLDLRALGDVDSPEVVHAALSAFRRRIFTRYVWILLVAVLLVAGVIWGRTPTTLPNRVDQARTFSQPGVTWRMPNATIGLERVSDLGDTLGLKFEVVPDPGAAPPTISSPTSVNDEAVGFWTRYIEVPNPASGVVTVTVEQGKSTQKITFDLAKIYVPDSYWKG